MPFSHDGIVSLVPGQPWHWDCTRIACLRSLGLPARYVSGYIETLAAPGKEKLVGSDASHAWISVYCHAHGWIDVDPTNNLLVSTQHVTIGEDAITVT